MINENRLGNFLFKSQQDMSEKLGLGTQAQFQPSHLVAISDPRGAQLLALFNELDERGKLTTLALLATAVKLHPKVAA